MKESFVLSVEGGGHGHERQKDTVALTIGEGGGVPHGYCCLFSIYTAPPQLTIRCMAA